MATMEELDPTQCIEDWLERFEALVEVNKVYVEADAADKPAKKRALLLSLIGPQCYRLLKSYLAPDLPSAKTYAEIKACLTTNLAPKTSAISEAYKLSQLKQETSETITVFMSRVKLCASKCNFGTSYDRMVRDKFICGLKSEKIRAALINDTAVETSQQAFTKALAREANDSAAQTMRTPNVNFVYKNKKNKNKNFQSGNRFKNSKPSHDSRVTCKRCKLRGHDASNCGTVCHHCKKIGHIRANCYSLKRNRDKVNQVEDEQVYSGEREVDKKTEQLQCDYVFHMDSNDSGNLPVMSEVSNCDFIDSVCSVTHPMSVDVIDTKSIGTVSRSCENSLTVSSVSSVVDYKKGSKPFVTVLINGKSVDMEVDTGSDITCMSKSLFDKLNLTGCSLAPCSKLIVANGQSIEALKTSVFVRFKTHEHKLNLRIVEANFPTLLGRDWMDVLLGEDWFGRLVEVNHVQTVEQIRNDLIEKLKSNPVFQPGVGRVTDHEACLDLKADVRPKFCKARPVAYAERDEVSAELERLVKVGYYAPVDSSPWASPVVAVRKSDKSLRLCGDYKKTINPSLDMKVYPLPTVEDCFVGMKGGQHFSRIDIKQAYNSLPLRESDQILGTINTHQGLYKPLVLPYGINSASGIFQSVMDNTLKGLDHVTCRVDDILITGKTTEEHVNTLLEVITRLEKSGFKCRWDKSEFLQDKVIYLGYEISKEGVRPCRSKVETLAKAPYPKNVGELISFLGAIQYYSRFLKDMSTLIEPLNRLRTGEWKFETEERNCFDELKKRLMSHDVLIFYDPLLPIRVDCDASSYGLGAVISHVDKNGIDRPIEFISRRLTETEKKYSQIDREALSIVWSIKRFHKYLYARSFELYTDHQPLKYIFDVNRGIPEMGSSRVQRWAVTLAAYDFTVKFRPTQKHGNADVCSRFPLSETGDERDFEREDLLGDQGRDFPSVFELHVEPKPFIDAELISRCTKKDTELSKVLYHVREGWSEKESIIAPEKAATEKSELRAFYQRKDELTVEKDCVLWGHRVIIPKVLRRDVLHMLHSSHMGMTVMKQLARNYVWWPGLDGDIEAMVRLCEACQKNQAMPKKSIPHPWIRTTSPWERLHIDYAGPFGGNMWMIVIDSYSKWIEVVNMKNNTTAPATIQHLRKIFSRFGLPKILVSDNARQLVKSQEFADFCTRNGIQHIPIPSYHPSSNGQCESVVGKFKLAMKKMSTDKANIESHIPGWLLNYHNTAHSVTRVEPAVLMMNRRLRSPLSLLNPLSSSTVKQQVRETNERIRSEKTLRRFQIGDRVLIRDILHKRWIKGIVINASDKIYEVETADGKLVSKHIDHVIADTTSQLDWEDESSKTEVQLIPRELVSSREPVQARSQAQVSSSTPVTMATSNAQSTPPASSLPVGDAPLVKRTPVLEIKPMPYNPTRVRRKPETLNYEKLGGE